MTSRRYHLNLNYYKHLGYLRITFLVKTNGFLRGTNRTCLVAVVFCTVLSRWIIPSLFYPNYWPQDRLRDCKRNFKWSSIQMAMSDLKRYPSCGRNSRFSRLCKCKVDSANSYLFSCKSQICRETIIENNKFSSL